MNQDPRFQQIFSRMQGRHRQVPGLQSPNPVIRFLSGILALLVFALMSFIGLMVFLFVLVVGIVIGTALFLWRRITGQKGPTVRIVRPGAPGAGQTRGSGHDSNVIDAEFEVIDRQQNKSG